MRQMWHFLCPYKWQLYRLGYVCTYIAKHSELLMNDDKWLTATKVHVWRQKVFNHRKCFDPTNKLRLRNVASVAISTAKRSTFLCCLWTMTGSFVWRNFCNHSKWLEPTNKRNVASVATSSVKRFIDVFCEAQFSTRYVPWQVVFRKRIWNYVCPIIPFPGLSWAFFFAETDLSVCIRKVLYLQLNSNEIWRLIFRCRSWWPIYVH